MWWRLAIDEWKVLVFLGVLSVRNEPLMAESRRYQSKSLEVTWEVVWSWNSLLWDEGCVLDGLRTLEVSRFKPLVQK